MSSKIARTNQLFQIDDNLPSNIPITVGELQIIERYLGPLFSQLLDDAASLQISSANDPTVR